MTIDTTTHEERHRSALLRENGMLQGELSRIQAQLRAMRSQQETLVEQLRGLLTRRSLYPSQREPDLLYAVEAYTGGIHDSKLAIRAQRIEQMSHTSILLRDLMAALEVDFEE